VARSHQNDHSPSPCPHNSNSNYQDDIESTGVNRIETASLKTESEKPVKIKPPKKREQKTKKKQVKPIGYTLEDLERDIEDRV
jgi:hypothetical protein